MEFPAWDPVLFDIPFLPIDVRWYGMMYVVGFLCAQWIFVRLAKSGFFPVKPEIAPDLIFYCVFGVMLGGRTGYALFYDQSLLNPLQFVQVWKGGLAFHGGLAGVGVAVWLFCRKYKLSWGRVGDACALAVTPGILAVRCANFINGELYGRVTSPDTWGAMQFPTDPIASQLMRLSPEWTMRDRELCIQVAYGHQKWEDVLPRLSEVDASGDKIDWVSVQPYLDWEKVSGLKNAAGEFLIPYRHPSQLYEGIGEGLVMGLVLVVLYLLTRRRPLRTGYYLAIFMLGYAAIRFGLEYVRQPDDQFRINGNSGGTVLFGMTMGQTLSAGLVVWAILILLWPRRGGGGGGADGGADGSGGEPPADGAS